MKLQTSTLILNLQVCSENLVVNWARCPSIIPLIGIVKKNPIWFLHSKTLRTWFSSYSSSPVNTFPDLFIRLLLGNIIDKPCNAQLTLFSPIVQYLINQLPKRNRAQTPSLTSTLQHYAFLVYTKIWFKIYCCTFCVGSLREGMHISGSKIQNKINIYCYRAQSLTTGSCCSKSLQTRQEVPNITQVSFQALNRTFTSNCSSPEGISVVWTLSTRHWYA